MNDDHLSPEPLSSYSEVQTEITQAETTQSQQSTETKNHEHVDVSGAFTKEQLAQQVRELDTANNQYVLTPKGQEFSKIRDAHFQYQSKQIQYRSKILEKIQNKARDDFNIYSDNRHRGLER